MPKASITLITIIILSLPFYGFSQLSDSDSKDSSSIKNYNHAIAQRSQQNIKTFIPGIIAVGYSFIALNDGALKNFDHYIAEKRNERRPNFHTAVDDYLRYTPFIALYGLDALGIKGKHNIKDKTSLVLLTGIFAYGSLTVIKNASNKIRPNHADDKSFPSGHATIAFVGAELLNQEYGDLSPWYSVAGYTVASATSVLRIYNNAHWLSDVIGGAGLGILSTKLAYVVFPPLKKVITGNKSTSNFTAIPSFQQHVVGVSIVGSF